MSRRTIFSTIAAAVLAAALLGACSSLDDFQRQVIFRPSKESGRTPAEYQAKYEDVWLNVANARAGHSKVHAWWIPAISGGVTAPAALYLHGAGFGISANLFGKLLVDEKPAFPLTLRDVDGFLLKEDTTPDRALMPRLPGRVLVSRVYPLTAFSEAEWDSEERARYLAEYGRDVESAQAHLEHVRRSMKP